MSSVQSFSFGRVMVSLSFCFWRGKVCFASNGEMQVAFSGGVLKSEAGNVILTDSRGVKVFCCLS